MPYLQTEAENRCFKSMVKRSLLENLVSLFLNVAFYEVLYLSTGGTRWRSWLRHCTTNRNVSGSIPGGVFEIFH